MSEYEDLEKFMIVVCIVLSYLIGSIPTAYIFGKLYKGVDIRAYGSGNIGATNAFRVLGKIPGSIVLILDILKGVLPIVLLSSIFEIDSTVSFILIAIASVCGHNWTIFLKFKGGKGIATTLGVLIGLSIKIPGITIVLILTVFAWAVCFLLTKIVSLSSIFASVSLPVIMITTGLIDGTFKIENVYFGVLFCIFVVLRHKSNIKRILSGAEPRVSFSPKSKK